MDEGSSLVMSAGSPLAMPRSASSAWLQTSGFHSRLENARRPRALAAAVEACNWYPGALREARGAALHPSAGERDLPEIAGIARAGGEHHAPGGAPFERQDIGQPGGEHQPLRGQRGEGPGLPRGPRLHRDGPPVCRRGSAWRPSTSTSSPEGDQTG